MSWPWHFVTVSEAEKQHRRELLDLRGYVAQLAILLAIILIRLYNYSSSLAQKGEKRTPRSRQKSWLDLPPFTGWVEARRQYIICLLWLGGLIGLAVWNTGDDYLHLTKALGHIGLSQIPLQIAMSPVLYISTSKPRSSSLVSILTSIPQPSLTPYHRVFGRVVVPPLLLAHATLYDSFFLQSSHPDYSSLFAKRILDRDVQWGIAAVCMVIAVMAFMRPIGATGGIWKGSIKNRRRAFYIVHVSIVGALCTAAYFHVKQARSMRSPRLLGLLVTGVLVCLSLVFLRHSRPSHGSPRVASLVSPPPPPLQQPMAPAPAHADLYPKDVHPIAALIQDAEEEFNELLSRQSKNLADAVKEYRRRYGLHPPPHFDKWFIFAQSRGVQLIDEYDTIYETLLPFWALAPETIRARAREALGYDNSLLGILIRDGKVSLAEGGLTEEQTWQRVATLGMMKEFVQYLPDLDLVFNAHDEPRVILPSEDLQRLVAYAKDHAIPTAFQTTSIVNEWSDRPSDLNRGDRIDEVRTTRFNRFSHQPAWTSSRMSCPVESPVRSLDENAPDNTDRYAHGDLGFIYNTSAFSDICNAPSLRYTYGFFDRPNVFAVVHDLFPVFSQSKISSFQDILYPSPWYWAKKVPYVGEKDVSWEDKTDKLYWRGSTTGGYSRGGGWRRQHRQLMVGNINALNTAEILSRGENGHWGRKQVSRQEYHALFDVQFTSIGQCDAHDCAAQREFFNVSEPAGQQEAWGYKYLIDIDGNAFSGRYHAFLESNSLVCKVALFREWHDERIKPWVHYVPLSFRGDEFVETMRYFVSEDAGRTAGPRLAQNGQEWAQRSLRNEDMEVWFFRVLLEYGRLVDDNRDNLGFY
ncbi:hypothetical protein AOCH_004186 [Aspergillus ochraceoroseus]|uniref:Glycosyl transferase CAP10 domain-containing protein n=2 Tax=Aspergillus ochraceoroseus TaxID=138278 RepID=A0A0F8UH76_9EURO|nr:hypothetical protein AOCH_004186 [Aspergillus ochraceoroseus]